MVVSGFAVAFQAGLVDDFTMKPLSLAIVALLICPQIIRAAAAETNTDQIRTLKGDLIVHILNHATFALEWNEQMIYVDPVGPAERFARLNKPDLVLITDIHGDHLSVDTLRGVVTDKTRFVVPPAVADQLAEPLRKRSAIMTNGQTETVLGIKIEAVPMYNTTPDRLRYHPKGRGNGYVLTLGETRIYISGDTEDIPEMRSLKDIDIAFVCMNLPYTMTVEQAASAVREFKPKIVYPYHCRGSDLEKFKSLVGNDLGIEVRLRDWYRP